VHHAHSLDHSASSTDGYLLGRGEAWFAFAMTIGLMLFDYIDRQVIVSLFPYIKAAWGVSDKQLGALVSVVSVTVAIGALPIALIADRGSRVKSIFVMATAWSLATISCMFTRSYSALFAARAVVGVGEAGYGSVGAALLASLFPTRMRAALLGAFFAAASIGSVLGVLLGGVIASRWGWQAAFGVVGIPGLLMALLYLRVRDYRTVALTPSLTQATTTTGSTARYVLKVLAGSRTLLWLCLGGAAQLIVVSSVWAWLPSFLNRVHGVAPDHAGVKAAMVVLAGAVGGVLWGVVVDRAGRGRPRNKLALLATLCTLTLLVLAPTFWASTQPGLVTNETQFALILVGGLLMTCSAGPASAMVIDVVHPGVRATGASVLALIQNLLGLAVGPFVTGLLSDALDLNHALAIMPAFSILAALFFLLAARTYESDLRNVERVRVEAARLATAPAAA
jgi:MFS transporter, Spinster family, sphingosine-1-phosphate transporter